MGQLMRNFLPECRAACHERVVVRILVFAPMSVDAYVLDADDLAVFRAQTSAQTAAEHINLLSVHFLCRPLQARTAAITHLPSAPAAPAGSCVVWSGSGGTGDL